jgi:methionyl-tRNA formyltransferase
MRTLFFGTAGRFSAIVMQALLAAGVELAGLVIAAPPGGGPLVALPPARPQPSLLGDAAPPNALQLAGAHGIPAFAAARLAAPATLAALAALGAEIGCVACFPRRLPPALIALPPLGVLNVHPSLLPALRGPEPLFWAVREGLAATGVTIHQVDAGLDTGPIILQEPLPIAEGISAAELEAQAAGLGGRLLVQALALRRGDALPQTQPAGGSYRGFPQASDFALDPAWGARRAFNFMRGTERWAMPYPLLGSELALSAALSYDPSASLDRPFLVEGGIALVQFTPGVLRARAG